MTTEIKPLLCRCFMSLAQAFFNLVIRTVFILSPVLHILAKHKHVLS